MAVIAQVIDQHVEEAAILWLRRERAVGDPHFTLTDLAQLDGQLEAHLDGLRVAEADAPGAAWQACERELRWNDPGEVFTAAILAWESGDENRVRRVSEAAAYSYDCSRALVSSLGWLTGARVRTYLDQWLASSHAFEQRVGIAACAVRGRDPEEALTSAVASRDESLQTRAFFAVGELARHDLLAIARASLKSNSAPIQFAAAWSVARFSDDGQAIGTLRQCVESQSPGHERALQLVLRRMPPNAAAAWINEIKENPKLLRSAVVGSGIVGVPEAIPWLLQIMATPTLTRVAGEAFTMITGVDLVASKLEGKWPDGFAAGPTEDATDDNVALDPDENLPWPDAANLAAWWARHQGEFARKVRHLCGRPLSEEWLEEVLRLGYQRQRSAAALELARMRPNQPLFNVRAPGNRQQELLGLRSP